MLPSFLIIGAMKCGTTSLHHYLQAHPQISMSKDKESDFFIEGRGYRRGMNWYATLFDGQADIAGEASPNYSKRHLFGGVPRRIHQALPDVKLIYMVRDPLKRAISHYVHNVAEGLRIGTFADAVLRPDSNQLLTSSYYYQLEAFLEYFDASNILIVNSQDLQHDTASTITRILKFIGADPGIEISGLDEQHHISSNKKLPSAFISRLPGRFLKRVAKATLPASVARRDAAEVTAITEDERRRFAELIADDVEKFQAFAGRELHGWQVLQAA